MDYSDYVQIIQKYIQGEMPLIWVIQLYNGTEHMEKCCLNGPPGLNPIENVWVDEERQSHKGIQPLILSQIMLIELVP